MAAGVPGPPAPAAFPHHHGSYVYGYMLLAPAFLVMFVTILLPVGVLLSMSFWSTSGFGFDTNLTLMNYAVVFSEPVHRTLVLRSLAVAGLSTFLTIALCYPVAYFLAFHASRYRTLILVFLTVPFLTGFLLRVFAWKVVLGYNGIINGSLISLGIVKEPLAALLYSPGAVILVMIHSWAVFVLLPIYLSLEKMDKALVDAASDLGDGPFLAFLRVIFPLSLPGVVSAFLLMFIPATGDYITPALVGGPDGMMAGNLIQAYFGPVNDWPTGAALTVVLCTAIIVSATAFAAINRLTGR